MKPLIAIAAVLASAEAPSAQSQPLKLECVGRGQVTGYPYGVQETRETRYRMEGKDQQVHILQRGPKDEDICPTGAACSIVATDDLVQVEVSNVPNADPLYSTRFRLDRNSLFFEASGGGLDGGWSITGKCTPDQP